MDMAHANDLLSMNPHPFEDGWKVDDSGIGLVAVRHELPDLTGAMVEWWFDHVDTTADYLPWHPSDHVASRWIGPRGPQTHIGGTHVVKEKFGDSPVHAMKINFLPPETLFDTTRFAKAGVSTAIFGRSRPVGVPVWVGNVLHLVHDAVQGCVMRSRFWLGVFDPRLAEVLARPIRRKLITEEALAGLHQHCREEMAFLNGFLPELYNARNGGKRRAS